MSVSRQSPPVRGGWFLRPHRSIRTALVLTVLLSLALGGLLATPAGHAPAPAAVAVSPVPAVRTQIVTHGDLVVTAGHTFRIQPAVAGSTYYQGGNITVQAGGTLIVSGAVLSFVQFVGPSGSAAQRLSHIYHFTDSGTVRMMNSTLTTNVIGVNVYPKLAVAISGTLTAWNSTFAFPGTISVTGGTAALTLNNSRIQENSALGTSTEWKHESPLLTGDLNASALLSVTGGAQFNLLHSNVTNLYADNFTVNGVPNPVPYVLNSTAVANNSNNTNGWTPNDTMNLTRDWLYPAGIAGGSVVFANYSDVNPLPTTADVTVWYGGVAYHLGAVTFLNNTFVGTTSVPFSPALTNAVNAQGLLTYLNYTGRFNAGPARISVEFTNVNGASIVVGATEFAPTAPFSNNIVVSGALSRLSAVDSSLNLTFNDTPVAPTSLAMPFPWESNKLVLSGSASAFLANITLENPIYHVFNASAIVADASSHAYLFRWARFAVVGLGGVLPVSNARLSAFYAYDNNTTNNATANGLNVISTSDPAIWGYVQYSDLAHGFPAYAHSNARGFAEILLAANDLTGSNEPGGAFLGGYHVRVTVPTSVNNTTQFNWSVSAYPIGEAKGTPAYGMPDSGPTTTFASYFGAASATVATPASIREGQTLHANVTVESIGAAPITSLSVNMFYGAIAGTFLSGATSSAVLNQTDTVVLHLTWVVNDSVTGLHGTFATKFWFAVQWNDGLAILGGGTINVASSNVTIQPSTVTIQAPTVLWPPNTLEEAQTYPVTGILIYNGTHPINVWLNATPTGGGTPIVLDNETFGPSHNANHTVLFVLNFNSTQLVQGTSYYLTLNAKYNTANTTNSPVPVQTFSVPLPPTSSTGWLTKTYFGLALWMWIAIAAAVAAGIVALLFFSRRQAAGKLVECGECGNLIPEDARVCPKCGAEFESDVVRCSRCASTIPAQSKFCPECAAQLLGRPEDGAEDPDRQGYSDFTERFRAEGKKELGENYTDSAFWDWWKRQPTYTPFSQWKLQQSQGAPRSGMAAPPAAQSAETPSGGGRRPPMQGRGGAASSAPSGETGAAPAAPSKGGAAPGTGAAMKACPSCSREIPSDYLVCPFCGSVTQ